MNDIGVFSPEQARTLWQDYQRRQHLDPQLSQNYPQRRPIDEVSPHRVFVKNTEAEVIPPYACLRVTGTIETGGRTALLVEKPTSVSGEFVFNGPYEIAALADVGVGWAYKFEIIVMLGDGTPPTAANVQYSPVVGSWTITESSGPFVVFGEHNAATDALIGRITSPLHIQVVLSADLFAAVNTKRDPSTATARILRRLSNGDLSLSTDTVTIVNRFMHISVDAGTYAKAEWIDGEWQLYAADCATGSSSGP